MTSGPAASELIADNRCCAKCGYNVNGLPSAGKCPECGTPLAPVTKDHPLLRMLGRARVNRIDAGLRLLIGGLIAIGLGLAAVVLGFKESESSGTAMSLFGLPLFGFYSAGWWNLFAALRGSERIDRRFEFYSSTLLIVAITTVTTPVLLAALIYLSRAQSPAVNAMLLAATAMSSGAHFLTMSGVLGRIARAVDGYTRRGTGAFHLYTLLLHGICLAWAILISIASFNFYFLTSIGYGYVLTLPFHAVWLVWAIITCVLLLNAVGIERRASGIDALNVKRTASLPRPPAPNNRP